MGMSRRNGPSGHMDKCMSGCKCGSKNACILFRFPHLFPYLIGYRSFSATIILAQFPNFWPKLTPDTRQVMRGEAILHKLNLVCFVSVWISWINYLQALNFTKK